jgi:retron-type reverse transcriptase
MSHEFTGRHRRKRKPTPFRNFNDPARHLSVSKQKSHLKSRTPFVFLPRVQDSFLLRHLASPENLMVAWLNQLENGSTAAGPDGITLDVSTGWAWKVVRDLSADVLSGRYHPEQCRDVLIPKSSGGFRTIQIPNVRDRLLGSAIASALKPLIARTLEGFYGRSRETMLAKLKCEAETHERLWMTQDDIKNCFPTANRAKLMEVVAARSRGWCVTGLPQEHFGIVDLIQRIVQGPRGGSEQSGVVQGGTLSPLLVELLLHDTVDAAHKAGSPNTTLCRYVDDICILGQSPSDAQEAMESVRQTVKQNGQELKGTNTGTYNLRYSSSEDRPSVLGLLSEWEDGQITFSLTGKAWEHLGDLLEECQTRGNAREVAMMTVTGWAQSIAPCIRKSTGPNTASRILARLRHHHIETGRDHKIPNLIESLGKRWESLVEQTRAQIQRAQPVGNEPNRGNLSGTQEWGSGRW